MKIDLLTASGHKIHGPKGTGFLYIGDKVKIKPIVFGGEQQKNIRSGTENVPGIAGLGFAARMIYQDLDMKTALMRELKGYFLDGISKIENTTVHGLTDEGSAPHIISVGIAGIRSEVLLHALEEKGIYVSSGSACSSNHPAVSGVLKGIGAAKEYLDATLRFSMSEFTTKEEIDYTLETLYNCVPMLRKIYETLRSEEPLSGGKADDRCEIQRHGKGEYDEISFIFDQVRRDRNQREEPVYVRGCPCETDQICTPRCGRKLSCA